MQFEFYVLNYNFTKHEVEMFNIFNNHIVNDNVLNIVKKYLRSPKKFTYTTLVSKTTYSGFEALCVAIDRTIAQEEHFRAEYEICVGYKFETNIEALVATDCYTQAHANIETIARDCIAQYKKWGQ